MCLSLLFILRSSSRFHFLHFHGSFSARDSRGFQRALPIALCANVCVCRSPQSGREERSVASTANTRARHDAGNNKMRNDSSFSKCLSFEPRNGDETSTEAPALGTDSSSSIDWSPDRIRISRKQSGGGPFLIDSSHLHTYFRTLPPISLGITLVFRST